MAEGSEGVLPGGVADPRAGLRQGGYWVKWLARQGLAISDVIAAPRAEQPQDALSEIAARFHGLPVPPHQQVTATEPVTIQHLTDLEARLLTHAENAARKDLEAWEKAREIANVRDALAEAGAPHDVDSVGVKVGQSGGGVSEYLRIAEVSTAEALLAAGAREAGGDLDAAIVRADARAALRRGEEGGGGTA